MDWTNKNKALISLIPYLLMVSLVFVSIFTESQTVLNIVPVLALFALGGLLSFGYHAYFWGEESKEKWGIYIAVFIFTPIIGWIGFIVALAMGQMNKGASE